MNHQSSPPSPVTGHSSPNNIPDLYIIAHDIRSLYNVGSLFRLADGVGLTKLYLTGLTGAPHNRLKHQRQRQQIAKTALEGLEEVDWEYHAQPNEIIQQLKAQGVYIVSLELTEDSQPIHHLEVKQPICIILGHETLGVSSQLQQLSDATIHLPMYGQGKSLNVITATAAALYHIRLRQGE